MRLMPKEKALKTLDRLSDRASVTKRISESSLENWMVNAFQGRRAHSLTMNYSKSALNTVDRILNIILSIFFFIICLIYLEIVTISVVIQYSSLPLVLFAFIYGNQLKMVFESIIFLFVTHPFDEGDECEIEGVQMVVEKIDILNTDFLMDDKTRLKYPNSVLATKAIKNFNRSPDREDAVEFCVPIPPLANIEKIEESIVRYVEDNNEHWCAPPMVEFNKVEEFNRVKIVVKLRHRTNNQKERLRRSSLLVKELVKILAAPDIQDCL